MRLPRSLARQNDLGAAVVREGTVSLPCCNMIKVGCQKRVFHSALIVQVEELR